MTEEISRDKNYKRIEKLNSPGSSLRRRSIVETTGTTNDNILLGKLDKETKDALPESIPLTKKQIRELEYNTKARYKNGADNFISYFDDVAFDYRPSILDGAINEPFQLGFKGPTLEKEIRAREKHNRDVLRKAVAQGTPTDETLESLDMSQTKTNFSGIYVALWIMISLAVFRVVMDHYLDNQHSFENWEILQVMTTDLVTVALADLLMYVSIYFSFGIHWLCRKGILNWNTVGWKIVSVYELAFLAFYVYLPEHILKLNWIAKIFLFLHSLVLLMKMHSFSFYNGYLWSIKSELKYSKEALLKLKDESRADEKTLKMVGTLEKSVNFCDFELKSQSTKEPFPENINLQNFFMFTMFPVVVYQIEYPRTEKIRWNYVVEKIFAIFGTIFIMVVDAQVFMYPIAIGALEIRDSGWTTWVDRLSQWGRLLIDIIPSFMVMYLLVFYLIWDAILNCIAELTRFGDRYFYGDWWNCVTWDEFSRIWNIPVHKFLLRHVYHSSIVSLKLSKTQATFMTFFISSVIHELSMYVIFKRLRFYLFFFQMLQLPLVIIGNSKFFREKTILGNVVFWISICTGPSVMCTLYLTI